MRFGIDCGHNCPPDTGVPGIKLEDILTKDVGHRVSSKLKALGYEVVDCNPSSADTVRESLASRCARANSSNVETYVSIHFNGFNSQANGTEVFAIGEQGRKIAQPVLDEIVKLGFFRRGVKNGSHLYVLRNTQMNAILVECCFCDSAKDMQLLNLEAMANAIVKGLVGKLPTVPIHPEPDDEKIADTSVIKLQKLLNRLKITDKNNKPLLEDNTLHPETQSAIEKFQTITGIQPTGIAGNTTWTAITQITAKRIIRENHASGPIVRYIQYRLGTDIDGVYGPNTLTIVKKYQKDHSLEPDGNIGPKFWEKLIG
jgi:N-acetylmuramoyl-L-alanine amidase